MKTLTATQASRGFSALLDSIANSDGDVTITRGGVPVARLCAVKHHTVAEFERGMTGLVPTSPRPDDGWEADVEELRALLTEPEGDPWGDD
ncbi:MAG: type II toxin-antitoxin system Phd/YefM family antitoxin [Micrococcales bacterium]|nr:type II toxin-antitoxin system Phd/YefM family antitoxin [Micrococcales bacterium]